MTRHQLEPVTLTGRHVALEPLSLDHVDDLLSASTSDRSTFGYTAVPDTAESMSAYIENLLHAIERGTDLPFVQRRLADDRLVGCTRFLEIRWFPGRSTPAEAEIGGTWLATDAQRSAVNTEAKLLMLGHAFDTWNVNRVAICTDSRNERSRQAIARVGATFEGILRRHRLALGDTVVSGVPRDTAVFSVIAEEWPAVRDRLTERLAAG